MYSALQSDRKVFYFTLSDDQFLPRTLAMCKSLRKYTNSDITFVHTELLSQISRSAFESHKIELIPVEVIGVEFVKSLALSRTHVEFMWTLPSVLLDWFVSNSPGYSDYVYLDADLFFYSDVKPIWDEIPPGHISITPHRFSTRLGSSFPDSGEFNVSWVGIPATQIGRKCAREWAEQCVRLCPEIPTNVDGKTVYGDQKYLEDWPSEYAGNIHVISHVGAGLAPWNYENYDISTASEFKVDEIPLIFYHFSSHQFGFPFASRMGREYSRTSPIPKKIYKVYELSLRECVLELGFKKWRSRHKPLWLRIWKFIVRGFPKNWQ
jgi:hypothetical protein